MKKSSFIKLLDSDEDDDQISSAATFRVIINAAQQEDRAVEDSFYVFI